MDIFIPEIQMIIYSYVHKIYMNDLIKELPIYMNNVNIKRGDMFKKCIFSMEEGKERIMPIYANKKISDEIARQNIIDKGIIDAQAAYHLLRF